MKIAIYQGPEHATDTLALLEREAAQAAAQKVDLLVFPELFLSGYNIGAAAVCAAAQARNGDGATRVAASARAHGVAIAYGYAERAGALVFNAVQLFDRTGVPRAHYRKTHLFGAVDRAVFKPGDDPAVLVDLDGVRLGFLICYDVEFPELVRGLALRGADLVVVPTAQMMPYEFVARILIPARAYENSVFVAYANHCGTEGEFVYTGESCIVGPDGGVLARAGRDDAMIIATLDVAALAEARRVNTYLADRRPLLYGALTA